MCDLGFCKTGFQTLGLTCGDAKLLEDPITTEYKILFFFQNRNALFLISLIDIQLMPHIQLLLLWRHMQIINIVCLPMSVLFLSVLMIRITIFTIRQHMLID